MHATTRQHRDAIRRRPKATVLIIGGGINGIGTFRDLALQGVDVTLVERGDFVSGTSAASSHMIHGGVRYLENGEFRLVRESVIERNRLLRLAPHYVRPLPTTIPIFSTFSGILAAPSRFLRHRPRGSTERGALLIKAGLTLYDSFSRGGGTLPRHDFLGARKSLGQMPDLNPGVEYTATYYDASMRSPERLALDVLRDGMRTGDHARCANYVEAVGSTADGVVLRDTLTGDEFTFHAEIVVNASGPWTDLTNDALGEHTSYLGGTKGSHIVLDHPDLLHATRGHEIFFEHNDGRIVLIHPIGDRVLVGTSDLEHDMADPIVCTEGEVDYFLDLIRHVFPAIVVDRSHIVYRFAGVRPLPRHDEEQPGFVSRDYRIEESPLPDGKGRLLSLVGGKWTTFRALSEHLSDRILDILGRTRRVSTRDLPIGGGLGYPTDGSSRREWIAVHAGSLDRGRVEQLLDRYGTYAAEVIDYLALEPDWPLSSLPTYSQREMEFLATNEDVVHLLDVLHRRTNIAFMGRATTDLLHELAGILGQPLDWDDERRHREIEAAERSLGSRGSLPSTA